MIQHGYWYFSRYIRMNTPIQKAGMRRTGEQSRVRLHSRQILMSHARRALALVTGLAKVGFPPCSDVPMDRRQGRLWGMKSQFAGVPEGAACGVSSSPWVEHQIIRVHPWFA
jgi:hypothetical protein